MFRVFPLRIVSFQQFSEFFVEFEFFVLVILFVIEFIEFVVVEFKFEFVPILRQRFLCER